MFIESIVNVWAAEPSFLMWTVTVVPLAAFTNVGPK
jgi:hypothetical protein